LIIIRKFSVVLVIAFFALTGNLIGQDDEQLVNSKPAEFAKRVKVFYISMGSRESTRTGRSIHEDLENAGIFWNPMHNTGLVYLWKSILE